MSTKSGEAYCVEKYREIFRQKILPQSESLLFPNVVKELIKLRSEGISTCIATSRQSLSAKELLAAAKIQTLFDLVVGNDLVLRPKPHTDMIELIMNEFKLTPMETVMVGDTSHDLLMAKSSCVQSIAVTYGVQDYKTLTACEPTWVADSFLEVAEKIRLCFKNFQA